LNTEALSHLCLHIVKPILDILYLRLIVDNVKRLHNFGKREVLIKVRVHPKNFADHLIIILVLVHELEPQLFDALEALV
jgi:hypothetical protein